MSLFIPRHAYDMMLDRNPTLMERSFRIVTTQWNLSGVRVTGPKSVVSALSQLLDGVTASLRKVDA
jgi:hypothetical protein